MDAQEVELTLTSRGMAVAMLSFSDSEEPLPTREKTAQWTITHEYLSKRAENWT